MRRVCPVLALAACSPVAAPSVEPAQTARSRASQQAALAPTASVSAPAAAWVRPDEVVAKWTPVLTERAVSERRVARRVLFSFTTVEQADAIAKGGPVLSREVSPRFGPSAFDWMLDERAAAGDKIARHLFRAGYAKKRFAWPSAYPIALGAGGGAYGTVLLRVELAEQALVLDLPRARLLTTSGQEVPIEELEKHAARLGAVYWEADTFREYVLVNESAIATVSFRTPEIAAVLAREAADLRAFGADLARLPSTQSPALLDLFAQSLAFDKPAAGAAPVSDVARVEEVARVGATLSPGGTPITIRPKASFLVGGPRARLRADCKLTEVRDVTFKHRICAPSDRCQTLGTTCNPIKRAGLEVD